MCLGRGVDGVDESNCRTRTCALLTINELYIGQTAVPYDIKWSRDRSTIGISIGLRVKAPVNATVVDVKGVLEEKKSWTSKRCTDSLSRAIHPQQGVPHRREAPV